MLLFSQIIAGFIGLIAFVGAVVNFYEFSRSDYLWEQEVYFMAGCRALFVFIVCLAWILCT